ncbi:hypothetical protein ILYODFUR_023838 [Ilyodon furcidens]|uniref:Uncharacterized protein n=1 Tax=Ilyodon furcidens TaxID=33524 RepID=A0ABV0VI42_9TELE
MVQGVLCPTLWVSLMPSVAHPAPTHMGPPPSSEWVVSHGTSVTSSDQTTQEVNWGQFTENLLDYFGPCDQLKTCVFSSFFLVSYGDLSLCCGALHFERSSFVALF